MGPIVAIDLLSKLLSFGWFAYAMHTHFEGQEKPIGMAAIKYTSLIGLFVNVSLILFLTGAKFFILVGLCVTVISSIIFFFAIRASRTARLGVAFSGATGQHLVSKGIFGKVRHPFYLSYLIYWLSWCLTLLPSIAPIIVFIALLGMYLLSIRIEERELADRFGSDYADYKKKTSLLIPGVF